MSLTAANDQLDKVRMELDNVTFKALSQGRLTKHMKRIFPISADYARILCRSP